MIQGYSEAKESKVKRIIMSVEGLEKSGKTNFGLTAPGPICVIDMDTGLEGVIEKFIKRKKIWVASFNYRMANTPDGWMEMWEGVEKAYLNALKAPLKEVRSVLVDTGTEAWELLRLAEFGKLSQVQAHHYGPVNARFRKLVRSAYDSDKNVIFLHKMKDQYVNNARTGELKRSGFSDMGYSVQMNILTKREEGEFGILIRDCRQNKDLAGSEYTQALFEIGFPFVASQVYPDTDEEDWS